MNFSSAPAGSSEVVFELIAEIKISHDLLYQWFYEKILAIAFSFRNILCERSSNLRLDMDYM